MNRLHVAAISLVVVASFLGGCSASGGSASNVTFAELEPADQDLLRAYAEGGEAWEAARARALADPDQTRFLVDNLARQMVIGFEHSGETGLATGDNPYVRARAELVRLGDASVPLAAGMLAEGDDVLAFHGTELLRSIGPAAVPALVERLEDPREMVRRRAAEAAEGFEGSDPELVALEEALVVRLETDSSWIVRAQSARALAARAARHAGVPPWTTALEAATAEPDLAVAKEAGRGLASIGDPRGIPALLELLDRAEREGHAAAARAAQESLQSLFGDPTPRGAAAWRDLWRSERTRLLERGASAR